MLQRILVNKIPLSTINFLNDDIRRSVTFKKLTKLCVEIDSTENMATVLYSLYLFILVSKSHRPSVHT